MSKYYFVILYDDGLAIDVVSIEELEDWYAARQRAKQIEKEFRECAGWADEVEVVVLCEIKREGQDA